jgi:hypothetical protein
MCAYWRGNGVGASPDPRFYMLCVTAVGAGAGAVGARLKQVMNGYAVCNYGYG